MVGRHDKELWRSRKKKCGGGAVYDSMFEFMCEIHKNEQIFWKTKWTNPSTLQIINIFHRRKLSEHISSFSAASARDNGQMTHISDPMPSRQRWRICHQIETKINLYFLKKKTEIINVNINANKRKILNVISGYIK